MEKQRCAAVVAVYLILKIEGKVLLMLRQNTGYCDGQWALVSGHVEEGETASQGMCREAHEEVGITIDAKDLKVVHIMHRNEGRNNIEVFFECSRFTGELANQEPAKCAGLKLFDLDQLPTNTMTYVAEAIKLASQGITYSEKFANLSC